MNEFMLKLNFSLRDFYYFTTAPILNLFNVFDNITVNITMLFCTHRNE